jgi:hypothetical protein
MRFIVSILWKLLRGVALPATGPCARLGLECRHDRELDLIEYQREAGRRDEYGRYDFKRQGFHQGP